MNCHAFDFVRPNRSLRELKLLGRLQEDPRASQRELGRAASLTAAMVNQYILEFAAHGWIEVEGETNRTLAYRVTEAGRARRRDLESRYLDELGVLHACIRDHYRRTLEEMFSGELRRAGVLGENDKAALVRLAAGEAGIELDEASPQAYIDCRGPGLTALPRDAANRPAEPAA